MSVGNFYRIPEKSPTVVGGQNVQSMRVKDQTLKKIGILHFPDLQNEIGPKILFCKMSRLGISPTIYRARNPKTPKSLKKVSREEFGTPDPEPPKSSKKGPKSPKNSQSRLFLDFSDLFRIFLGVRSRGSQTLFGRLF